MPARTLTAVACLALLAASALAESEEDTARGPWPVAGWSGLPSGRRHLQPSDFAGRVAYLLIYRARDAAANDRALRALARLARHYGPELAIVAIESADPGRPAGAVDAPVLLRGHGLAIPSVREVRPSVRARYGARPQGPWTVLFDARGRVRRSGPARPFGEARPEIDVLLEAQPNPLVGTAFGSLRRLRWLRPARPSAFAEHRLTLVRWWTHGCRHCAASVPALSRLAARYRPRGLRFLGIYHRKLPPRLSDAAIGRTFDRLGGVGALAVDEGWRVLNDLRRRGRLRIATSISLLVDRRGVVHWVHAGPRIHPVPELSGNPPPEQPGPGRDMRALTALLERLLGE